MGELLALLTAVSFAASNVLVRVAARQTGGDRLVLPTWDFQLQVMRWTTVVNVVLLWTGWWVALAAGRAPVFTGWNHGIWAFAAAGVCGPFLARIVLYRGLAHLGPGRLAAGKALAPAIAATLAAAWLGEPLSARLGMAIGLIGLGTLLTVGGGVHLDRQGFAYGLHTAWWLALSALFRRVGVLALPDALLGAALGSTVALLLVSLLNWRRHRAQLRPAEAAASPAPPVPAALGAPEPRRTDATDAAEATAAPAPAARLSLIGSGVLSTVALIASIAALAYAPVGPVMALHHTEPALAQWLGHLALRGTDRVRPGTALGTLCVVLGALLV